MPLSICNSALAKIGVEPITSLTQNTKAARFCNTLYSKLRDDMLISHFWNFAMNRVALAAVSTTPPFGYGYAYQLGSNCLRVRKTDDDSDEWNREGNLLYSNRSSVMIQFIDSNTSPSKFSASFREALALNIASELAYAMTQSTTLGERLYAKHIQKLKDARSFDGQEGTQEELEQDVWLEARMNGASWVGNVEV